LKPISVLTLACRQQVEHGLAPSLRQLGDSVGRVVGSHPAEHGGDLGIRARAQQPAGQVLVQFLEHVGLKFGVGVHLAENLAFLFLRGALQQIRDLGRLEAADPAEGAPGQRAAGVPDQRLEPGPRAERMLTGVGRTRAR
jgi:hypothetical protein